MSANERVPIQVYLDLDQHQALKRAAEKLGSSLAAVVRESIDKYLAEVPIEIDPAMEIIAIAKDTGPSDLSERVDDYLYEIYQDENRD